MKKESLQVTCKFPFQNGNGLETRNRIFEDLPYFV